MRSLERKAPSAPQLGRSQRSIKLRQAKSCMLRPRSIWGVGKNYVKHIEELKGLLQGVNMDLPKEPLVFLKSAGTLLDPALPDGQSAGEQPIPLPLPVSWSNDLQHEVELAVSLGDDLKPTKAAVAIDLTARDIQASFSSQGKPWTLAKSFHASCPYTPAFDVTDQVKLQELVIVLQVNGTERQRSSTGLMIFPVTAIVDYLKCYFPVEPGDLVLTGTPAGVGKLQPGDMVCAW
eukprot:CAMPEP_0202389452 /NCGR_PEP_ID=MMETSP1127-20130417/82998_1 /ASSEMBLY_ACC=CAM_ASM_000462 /TAXON_ID=3047 /ORGANISM="Dunaliella tertiolecta, Strain CCMP1320" /LENGTH=233 /DNA_ID=CAMNT_0048991193 /DNA_START=73 /DNA_END=771 /DNA_ORIENTATION=+